MLTIPNIKIATNLDLARTALDCLEELKHRGNKDLDTAIVNVLLFHSEILALQSMINEIGHSIDYGDEVYGLE